MRFSVEGRPVPQGSMTASYNRKTGVSHVHHVQGAALAQWRAAIRLAASEAGATVSVAPVAITITFGMPRPKTHLVLRGGRYVVRERYLSAMPAVAPDIDKLTRAVLDALSGVCYADDAQVVSIHAQKVYGNATTIEAKDAEGLGAYPTLGIGA